MPKHVGLTGVQRFLEERGLVDMKPQRPLVLVRDRSEGFPGGVIENVVLEAVDDVLAADAWARAEAARVLGIG